MSVNFEHTAANQEQPDETLDGVDEIVETSFISHFLNVRHDPVCIAFYAEVLDRGKTDELKIHVPNWMASQKDEHAIGVGICVFKWQSWVSDILHQPTWLDVAAVVNDMMNQYEYFPHPFFHTIEEEPCEDTHALYRLHLGAAI